MKKVTSPINVLNLIKDIGEEIILSHSFSTNPEKNKRTYMIDKISYKIEISNKGINLDIKYGQGNVNTFWIDELLIQNIKREEISLNKNFIKFDLNENVDLWTEIIHASSKEELINLYKIHRENSNIVKPISKIIIDGLVQRKTHPITWKYLNQNYHDCYFSFEIDWWIYKEYEIKKIKKEI